MCLHSLKVGFTKFVTDGTFVGLVHYVDTLVVSENGLPAGGGPNTVLGTMLCCGGEGGGLPNIGGSERGSFGFPYGLFSMRQPDMLQGSFHFPNSIYMLLLSWLHQTIILPH